MRAEIKAGDEGKDNKGNEIKDKIKGSETKIRNGNRG